MTTFKDKLGREVSVGDVIIYGHAIGRSAGLRIGKVLKIVKKAEGEFYSYDSPWRIGVIGVDDDWDQGSAKLARRGTLQFPSRIVKISADDLALNIRNVLEEVACPKS